jgi:cytochrome P450 / NADPH-cytochrome P450 reductase
MAGDAYSMEVRAKRLSVLDLLESFPTVDILMESFLEMLPTLRPRLYSVSSAPGWKPGSATITYSVLDVAKYSGSGRFLGAASNYLTELTTGAVVRCGGRKAKQAFRLPKEPESHPIIMIAAGSGIAPFRGFIQERELQRQQGKSLAPALLFFGCRGRDLDDLYRDEIDKLEQNGAVSVYRAYSIGREHQDARGCGYVQDRVALERQKVYELWSEGASVFICGSHRMADGVKEALFDIVCPGSDRQDSSSWLAGLEAGRVVREIFT